MDTALWIAQGVLAAMFLMVGSMKLMRSKAQLAERMEWVNDFSSGTIKFIGIAEVLGAIGVILPWALWTVPILTPIAAAGLGLVQILAAITHGRRKEYKMWGINFFLLALAAFVAIARGQCFV